MPKEIEAPKKPTCFVIMPFSDPEGYPDGHFRRVYEYTFKPAIEAAGYTALRIDDNSVSNLIHSKMMNELVNAPMVLCDLSTNNPNVLYELGIRHAFDKPVVLVQEMGQNRIFDIAGITSVEYHPTRLYEETEEDHKRIRDAIVQTAEAKSRYSIMSMVALQSAQPIDDGDVSPEQQTAFLLQQMMQKITNLENQVRASQGDDNYIQIFDPANKSPYIKNDSSFKHSKRIHFRDKTSGRSYLVDPNRVTKSMLNKLMSTCDIVSEEVPDAENNNT